MMYDSFDRGLVSIAQATAIAAALCFAVAAPLRAADQPSTNTPAMTPAPAAAPTKDNATAAPAATPATTTPAATGPTKDFTEDDVNTAVKKVVDERTKDGAFVFRDPKLNADLHLIFDADQERARHARLWLVPERYLSRQGRAEEAIRHRLLVQARGARPEADGYPCAERSEAGRRQLGHDHPLAAGLVVVAGRRAPWRHGGDPRLAGDERHPRLYRHP